MEYETQQPYLFGVKEIPTLKQRFIEPPFSVINSRTREWQERKSKWRDIGIRSEEGRDVVAINDTFAKYDGRVAKSNASIFDPVLCDLMYSWFCPESGKILDPFAGGSVRGIVAHYLGYGYTGIDLSERQVRSNLEQSEAIIPDNQPTWIVGDADEVLDGIDGEFDFVFSCPPYHNLEVYSDDPRDLSNMGYDEFLQKFSSIVSKCVEKLKRDCYACFVMGDVRDNETGVLKGLIADTIKIFKWAGMDFYNDIVFLTPIFNARFRARQFENNRKVVKVHQNILVFRKRG